MPGGDLGQRRHGRSVTRQLPKGEGGGLGHQRFGVGEERKDGRAEGSVTEGRGHLGRPSAHRRVGVPTRRRACLDRVRAGRGVLASASGQGPEGGGAHPGFVVAPECRHQTGWIRAGAVSGGGDVGCPRDRVLGVRRGTLCAVATGPLHQQLPSTEWSTARKARLVAGIVLILYSYVMAAFWRVPYILVEPGGANNVMSLIDVEGPATYPPDGQLLFLTVSLSKRITPLRAVQASLRDDVEVVEEEDFTGGQSREEIRRLNFKLMQISKQTAITVALEALGHEIEFREAGALVTSVIEGMPADGELEAGDVIVAVDGRPVEKADHAIDAVQGRRPGSTLSMVVERDGARVDRSLTTTESDEGNAQIGIRLTDNVEAVFPFDIDIDTGRVGGPSAGLAFALAVIDTLTDGELTGGNIVAVTGSITASGEVEPVGGVAQKAVAARRMGAVLMLVPSDEKEVAEARRLAGSMPVVGVANLQEALQALAQIGGNTDQALASTSASG